MDISQLCTILEACMSPNQQQRAAAEQTLEQFQHAKGQLVNLLRIAVEPSLGQEVRQSAAISFKNLVKRSWKPTETPSPIPEEDKASVRENLVESIIRAPPPVRVQLGECFKSIVWVDYPDKWPGLQALITQNLSSDQDRSKVVGSLFALRILARKYEFRGLDERPALEALVDATFPPMLQLVQQLLASNSTSLETAEALRLAFKTFWSVVYMGVPTLLLRTEQFVGWMTAFHTLLARPVPQEGQPADPSERRNWPWWKVEKWVMSILNRLYSRYGEARPHGKGSNERAFAEAWQPACAQQFLEDHMAIASRVTQGAYHTPRVTNLMLQYLTHAVGVRSGWKLIKPHAASLLTNCVFPLLCFDEDDEVLWTEDPQEYIRKGYDLLEDMYSAKTAAVNLVVAICRFRGKSVLDGFMRYIVQVMTEYQAADSAGQLTQRQAWRMDGALLAVGSLHEILKRKEPYTANLEPMLLQFVVPMFTARAPHLRAKAAWLAGHYADLDFKEGSGYGPTFTALFSSTVKLLRDSDLPVRVDAVIGLRNLVEAFDEEHLDMIRPHIGGLLDQLFGLMAEIENEDLVFTLETVVEKLGEDTAPFAVGLCQHLTQAFWRLQSSEAEDEDESDEGALAAFGCLRALSTVLESVSSLPELFGTLEPVVFPVLQRLTGPEGRDVYEEVMEILSYFTYFAPEISQQMWTLWPQLYQAYNEWAFDYFENMLVPIDNYISRGTDVFLAGQNPNYLTQAVHMAEKALTDVETNDGDLLCAPKLLGIIMLNCRGRVDQCIPHFIGLALSRLASTKERNLRDQLVGVVACALYYNPALALHTLQQQSQLTSFMNLWFEMIFAEKGGGKRRHFRRQHDKKLGALALASLLGLPSDGLPQELQTNLGNISAGSVKLLFDLQKQQESAEAQQESSEAGSLSEYESGSDDEGEAAAEDGEEEEEEEEEPDASTAEDEAYMQHLTHEAAKLAGVSDGGDSMDGDWTDDEEEASPLDDIDPFLAFSDALKQLQASQPAQFGAATANLDPRVAPALQSVLQHAELIRAKKSVIGTGI